MCCITGAHGEEVYRYLDREGVRWKSGRTERSLWVSHLIRRFRIEIRYMFLMIWCISLSIIHLSLSNSFFFAESTWLCTVYVHRLANVLLFFSISRSFFPSVYKHRSSGFPREIVCQPFSSRTVANTRMSEHSQAFLIHSFSPRAKAHVVS